MNDSSRGQPGECADRQLGLATVLEVERETNADCYGSLTESVNTPDSSARNSRRNGNSLVRDFVDYDDDPADTASLHQHYRQLARLILDRIRNRLPGRIRRLGVQVNGNAIVLVGQCSTYYSKQMAQHVAMGVLNYERLVNNIRVSAPS